MKVIGHLILEIEKGDMELDKINKTRLLIRLGVLILVNAAIDVFGIYLPLHNEFPLGYLSIFMVGIFVVSLAGILALWMVEHATLD